MGKRKSRRPATTDEGRENQLASLAHDLAEKQLTDGSATSQVITHYLKLSSSREKLEQERLRRENELLTAKVAELASRQHMEEVYSKALKAMSLYTGQDVEQDEELDAFDDEG